MRRALPDVTGLKIWVDPVAMLFGRDRLTPYGIKEKRRRRAANRVAKQARKRNRS